MAPRLQGKTAIVTGASSGIGMACARALASEGARLVLTARRQDRLEALAAEIGSTGMEPTIVPGDAREETTAIATIEAAEALGRIDILINNVGIGNYKELVDTSSDEYDELMDTNVRSTFLFTRHAVPVMVRQREGTILMISSMAGVYGFANQAVYCATKFAQVGFSQALDRELRPHGIKVGVICPGGVKNGVRTGSRSFRRRRGGIGDARPRGCRLSRPAGMPSAARLAHH
jgi:3-oxoacyl-[acyl-carrier protein] reductase